MPVLAVGRDHHRDNVAVSVVLAAAVVFRLALLDADPGNEAQTVEVAVLHGAALACLRAHVVRLNAARGFDDRPQLSVRNIGSLCVAVGRPGDDHALPQFALSLRPVDDDEFEVEHLAAAVLRALEESIVAGTARTNGHLQGRDCPVGDQLGAALFGRDRIIESHSLYSFLRLSVVRSG